MPSSRTKNPPAYVGQKSGLLTVLGEKFTAVIGRTKRSYVVCECDCGRIIVTQESHIRSNSSKSCGCVGVKKSTQRATSHGQSTKRGRHHRIYVAWLNMLDRTRNPNTPNWKRYGAMGIRVCEEWSKSFDSFLKWSLANGYQQHLTIDRIRNEEGYCPENCRWATRSVQCHNRKKRSGFTSRFRGVNKCGTGSKWAASIRRNGKTWRLGTFSSEIDAARAYDNAAKETHGGMATLNFPDLAPACHAIQPV
jgi:hypothetical protein